MSSSLSLPNMMSLIWMGARPTSTNVNHLARSPVTRSHWDRLHTARTSLDHPVSLARCCSRERAGHRQGDHEHGDDERGGVGAPVGEGGHGHGDGGHEEGNECPGRQELGYIQPVVAQVVDRIAGGEQEAEEQEDLTRVGQDERKAQKSGPPGRDVVYGGERADEIEVYDAAAPVGD